MKTEVLGITEDAELLKAAAKIVWEDSDRPSQEVFFGVPKEFGEYLCCNSQRVEKSVERPELWEMREMYPHDDSSAGGWCAEENASFPGERRFQGDVEECGYHEGFSGVALP